MKKILTILFFLLIFPAFAITEDSKISLADAIELALDTNPEIKIAKLGILQAENEIKIAGSLQNPNIGTFQNIGQSAKGNPQEIGVDYVIEILKRGKRKETAKSNLASVQNDEKFLEQKLILNVKLTYFDFLLKKSNLRLIEEQKEISKQILSFAQEQYEKQKLSKTDLIQAKIEHNRAVMYANIAKSEVISSQNRFNTAMNSDKLNFDTKENGLNEDYEKFLTLEPKKIFYDFQKIKNFALENRYDIQAKQKETQIAKNKLNEVKSKLIPDLQIEGGYSYMTKNTSDRGGFRSAAYAGVGLVNVPIMYRYQPEIKNAQLEIEKAQLKYEDLKIDVTRDVTDAWEKYEIARNNLNFYDDELLVNSKELLDEAMKNLDNNKIDLTGFFVSKKLYLELMLGYQQALSEYYISFAELLKELNIKSYKDL